MKSHVKRRYNNQDIKFDSNLDSDLNSPKSKFDSNLVSINFDAIY